MNGPVVSVVMSVFNGEKYLNDAIESILYQTYTNYEFIIVNDGSTDGSGRIINSYNDNRIILLNQVNKGLAAALNYGVSHAKGKYIARLDADDIALPKRIERQIKFLEENKNCVITGSNAYVIDMNGKYLYTSNVPTGKEDILIHLKSSSPFYHSSVIFRKEIFEICGGYYEKIKHHFEDYILWNKMKEYGELCNITEPLIKYRLIPTAIANRNYKTARYMIQLAHKILEEGSLSDEETAKLTSKTGKRSNSSKMSLYFSNIGCIYLYRKKNKSRALLNFIRAFYYNPLNVSSLFFLILSVMPLFIVESWMKFRKISIS